jgi:hypothetical protein
MSVASGLHWRLPHCHTCLCWLPLTHLLFQTLAPLPACLPACLPAGSIPLLVDVLRSGTAPAKQHSARAIRNLGAPLLLLLLLLRHCPVTASSQGSQRAYRSNRTAETAAGPHCPLLHDA